MLYTLSKHLFVCDEGNERAQLVGPMVFQSNHSLNGSVLLANKALARPATTAHTINTHQFLFFLVSGRKSDLNRPYIQVDEESGANMYKALGISLPSEEDGDKKPAAKEEGAEGGI